MSIAAVLDQARALGNRTLTDAITVEVRDLEPTLDDWGSRTYAWTPIYSGPGLVQAATSREQAATEVAGQDVTITRYILKAPTTVELVEGRTYRVTVTDSLAPANRGAYRVTSWETNGWEILRRMIGVRDHGGI